MIHRKSSIVLFALLMGCNTFTDPESFGVADAGDTTSSDAAGADSGDPSFDLGNDAGDPAPDYEVSRVAFGTFEASHRLQTSVALLARGQSDQFISLAYRHDPNGSGDDGFIVSTPVSTPDFASGIEDAISGNESFESVAIVRDNDDPSRLLFSANFDNECSTAGAVDNTLHLSGEPGAATSVSASRDCRMAGTTIDVVGGVERFEALDGRVRFALLANENGQLKLSTSSPVNSIFNYIEFPLGGRVPLGNKIHAAPGLIGIFDTEGSTFDIWSGLPGESPSDATADARTRVSLSLGVDLDHAALSGAAPTRYEVWGASGSKLELFELGCSVADSPVGHVECASDTIASSHSVTLGGEIVGLDAKRSGAVAVASILTNESGAHSRYLAVYDGGRLDLFEVGDPLGDLVQSHISLDAVQDDGDLPLVAIATTYRAIDQGSSIRTDVEVVALSPNTN